MSVSSSEPALPGESTLTDAKKLLRQMSVALRKSITRLNRARPAEPDSKAVKEMIDGYKRSLQIVLSLEGNIDKRIAENGSAGGTILDLEQARQEIDERIARLRHAEGD
jgi:hypothetical protein